MVKLAIFGAGHLGEQMAHYAVLNNIEVVGFFDDTQEEGSNIHGIPILGGTLDILNIFKLGEFSHLILGLGYKHFDLKKKLQNDLIQLGIPFGNILCKEAYINPTVKLGDGVFIMPGVVVDQRAEIGSGVVINCNATISHDSKVGSYSFIGPSSTLSGFLNIGERSFLGANCTIIDNLKLENEVIIGAGAVVNKDCQGKSTYIGVPAKKK